MIKIEEFQNEIISLCREKGVRIAYLFGSYVQDTANPLSDIDIAILLSNQKRQDYQELRLFFVNGFMKILHQNSLDVVLLNEAHPALRFSIVKNGKLLYSDDEKVRIGFESQTIIDYLDTNFLRTEYNAYLFKNIGEGGLYGR